MKFKELAEYCQRIEDCEKCEHVEKCEKFKKYLQDCICPATTLISGCECIYGSPEAKI
ncbi:hypothetical protein AALB51_25365 [Lachnospiraceae bacterium 62-26]|nr:hypothetical protein IMSAGC020_02032 [Lachnospiraceae bacterium]